MSEKSSQKRRVKKNNAWKEQASGTRKGLSTALRTEGNKLRIQLLSIYLER